MKDKSEASWRRWGVNRSLRGRGDQPGHQDGFQRLGSLSAMSFLLLGTRSVLHELHRDPLGVLQLSWPCSFDIQEVES